MGKLQSKHVCGKRQGPEGECILVNTQFGSSLDKLSDFDKISADGGWPDLSFDQSVWQKVLNNQEVSVCLKTMSPVHQGAPRTNGQAHLPLRVVLPPEKVAGNKSCRLLTMDQECNKKLNDSETTDDNNKTLNVEEFECGVSVAGSDKQEWSFTLYDFDGKGKITKEDLGSLLRSLYDAVGSSINLPRSGTKTLKLRLTVSPDNSKVTGGTTGTTGTTAGTTSPRDNKNRPESNNRTKESKLNKDLDNSKLSGKDLKLDNISKAEQLSRTEQLNLESCGAGQEQKVHHKEVKNNLSCPGGGGGAGPTKTPSKPKLTTVEQRHLAELVQKNMERHQQRQQQRQHHRARRHNSDHRKHHSCSAATRPLPACEESRDRRNYYLDLAGIENDDPTSLLHNTSAPADLLSPRPNHRRSHDHRASPRDAKLRSRSHNARRLHQQLQQQSPEVGDVAHARSRSYDVEQCTLGPEEEVAAEVATTRTRQMERAVETKAEKTTTTTTSPQSPPTLQMASTPNKNQTHKLRPVSLPPNVPDAVSPHHHRRHRNRERNRKLAMQQVAEWIEREHAWNNATGAAKDEPKVKDGDAGNGNGATGNGAAGAGNGTGNGDQRVIVQRHEHHHVHEHHHHHHYHHYHET